MLCKAFDNVDQHILFDKLKLKLFLGCEDLGKACYKIITSCLYLGITLRLVLINMDFKLVSPVHVGLFTYYTRGRQV